MKKSLTIFISFMILALMLAGCATHFPETNDDPPGFFYGLFHGFILFFSFILSLFTEYEIYAFPNSGGWYNFGYLLGVMSFFGGGGSQARRKK